MKIIIFDFEVFKYNTLLGVIEINNNSNKIYQFWNKKDIINFYLLHQNDIWIGHNSYAYDDIILEAIINGKDPFIVSKNLINNNIKPKSKLKLYDYDLMRAVPRPFSLKLTELLCGKNIHTTDVSFDLDRPLSNDEKLLVENYNKSDLNQTYYNFERFYDAFKLRLDIINEFNLPLQSSLNLTGTQIAATVLKAKKDPAIIYKQLKPTLYDNLKLKNNELLNFYLNEDFRIKNKQLIINVCGCDLTIAAGGIHAAKNQYHAEKVLYFDVSGYYNLIMINLDLLPRTMPDESKELYKYMYHEQLRLKKINPVKRAMYKTILLSVFGAMNNEYTDFYDPWKALLVTITGELYLVDLLEKLEGLITIVQANTDGIMVIPNNWDDESKIIKIVEEWEKRTGFTIKKDHLYNLWQRDVNCYVCQDETGAIDYKGNSLKNYKIDDKAFAQTSFFNCTEPPIIANGIIDFLIYGISPEETIEKYKNDLRYFQYHCKKNSYDYLTINTILNYQHYNKFVQEETNEIPCSDILRLFAEKINKDEYGVYASHMIYKHKITSTGHKKAKVSNLPNSIFIYNNSIMDVQQLNLIQNKIDYQYYIDRIYEKIYNEFLTKGD